MSTPQPTQTPNVVIHDPAARNVIYTVFGWLSLAVAVAIGVDLAAAAFDISAFTTPAAAGLTIFGAGIGYTAARNTP